MSIAQKILANPSAYSIEMLTQGVQNGVIPAYIGIPLIQQKTQEKSQAAGMQGAQQGNQTPIAEEVLAQAQQASGVDQLPSNLPTQSYAPGGIVAFAGGGDVEYKYVRDFSGQMVKVPVEKTEKKLGVMDLMQQMSDYSNRNANNPAAMAPTAPLPPAVLPAASALQTPNQQGFIPGGSLPPQVTPPGTPPAAPGIDQLVKPPAAPTDTGAGTGTTGKASPFAFTPAPAGGSLFDMTKTELGGYATRAAARDKDLLNNLNEGKPVGKPLEDYKKSLQDEALQAGADRDQAKGMAIFKAGLAMMSGTSQYALENIGKGAMVGADDWQAANKDLKRAQKERQKELSAIELAERAEARDDFKSAQKYRAEATDRADARDRFGVSAYMNAGVKDKEIATTQWGHVLDAQMKKYGTDVGADTSRYVANTGASATRYAADRSADTRLQAAELKAAVAGAAAEGKGGLTQDQLLKWRGEYASHPEVQAFKKQLIDQYGKNVEGKPEFQQALAQKIDQILARDATRNIGGGAAPVGYKILGKE
jgi:hypothetical protein